MRVVFIGGVRFSRAILQSIAAGPLELVGVCTASDPRGADGLDLGPLARRLGVPTLDTRDLNAPRSVRWILGLEPDLLVCVGWPRLLRRPVLEAAPLGVLGYHPAALPRNRGRHPIIWTIALGLERAGSTFFLMDEGADSGPIVSQRTLPVAADETAGSLYDRLNVLAVDQLRDIMVDLHRTGGLRSEPQDHGAATSWRRRGPEDGRIDWRMDSRSIDRLVRALGAPYPGAHFLAAGRGIVVDATHPVTADRDLEPGKILEVEPHALVVVTGDGALRISTVERVGDMLRVGEYL